jgi:hypothetical protein
MVSSIEIQCFFGIGDALFLTPTLPKLKAACPGIRITINTRHPELFQDNPYVDHIGERRVGHRLMYCDPTSCTGKRYRRPTKHHIIADWSIIAAAARVKMEPPELKPLTYFPYQRGDGKGPIGVQTHHKDLWHGKKNWGKWEELSGIQGFEAIPYPLPSMRELAEYLTSCSCVVCAEGGISHLCRSLDVPCVVIYGGFADPAWNGYHEHTNLVTNDLDCAPCYSGDPCVTDPPKLCHEQITVSEVIQHAVFVSYRAKICWYFHSRLSHDRNT